MSRRKLVIFGTSTFAEMAYYLFDTDSDYQVAAFCIDADYKTSDTLFELPIVTTDELVTKYPPAECDCFVAIGITDLNRAREKKCDEIVALGYQLASFVSSSAQVANDCPIKPNTMIMENVIIHPYCSIGRNVIIWSASIVALKGIVEDNCWIVRSTFGESVRLGRNTFVGLESTISPMLTVGAFSILGTRAVVLKSAPEFSVFAPNADTPSRARSESVAHLFT
ncbi:MAG: hypothetical protein AAF525_05275 [Pseudomonadota bacterium]